MRGRRISRIGNGLMVIGLALSVMSLGAITSAPRDSSDGVKPPASLLGTHGADERNALVSVPSAPQLAAPTAPDVSRMAADEPRGHEDARAFLRDTAAEAHRYPWAGSRRGETRTDLWVNDPRMAGSTSPP